AEAEAQQHEAQAAADLAQHGYRSEEVAAANAAVTAANAALKALDQQIAELIVKAPLNGVIEAVELRKGDLVAANAPVLSLMDASHLWVRAYVPENRLGVQVGQKVQVAVDSFPGRSFGAHVSFI